MTLRHCDGQADFRGGEWGGLDTLHILAGVPSTSTLLDLAGVPLVGTSSKRRFFAVEGSSYADLIAEGKALPGIPSEEGMHRVAEEARACSEINFVGTVLSLACFVSSFPSRCDRVEA